MTETAVPATAASRLAGLCDYALSAAAEVPDAVLFRRRVGEVWQDVSAAAFLAEAGEVAKGLIATGVGPGDRVALMSATRYEWTLCDFAIWLAGAVVVPVYETSSAEQVSWILRDSGAVAAVVERAEHAALLDAPGERTALVAHWVVDDGDLDQLVTAGKAVDDALLHERASLAGPDDTATIIYTSGTTGPPKGCALTHANMRAEVDNVSSVIPDVFCGQGGSTLLFLPLAHCFARLIELGCVATRTPMGHTPGVATLLEDFASFRPTFVLAVPRVFEKIYNGSEQKAQAAGRGRVFRAAADTAVAWSQALDHGGAGLGVRVRHAVFDRLVYAKLRAAMGGRVTIAVSGGAPLGVRLGHFFRGAGIVVLEGYGLTETSAASTVNTSAHHKVGSVGQAIPGATLRIADDGEVLIQGPHVFAGYHRDPVGTAEVLRAGWFHSGDIGELDADGFLTITGRKKEIIVTAGGKNVAPAQLEDQLRAHALISQCMVVGDAQPYIAALITLDPDAIAFWSQQHDKGELTVAAAAADPDLLAEVQAAVDAANAVVSHAEGIKRFHVLPVDFTEAGGQLTPSMKLKRGLVLKEFASEVDALYS